MTAAEQYALFKFWSPTILPKNWKHE